MTKIKTITSTGIIVLTLTSFIIYLKNSDNIANQNVLSTHEDSSYVIKLRWSKSYPTEIKGDVIKGLAWSLSYLGAKFPKSSLNSSITWVSDSQFFLDLSKVGFDGHALQAFSTIIKEIKSSDEYRKMGGIDIGRFIILTLNSTNHYYAIINAPKTFDEFKKKYRFGNNGIDLAISVVSYGHRKIDISESDSVLNTAFIAYEGDGSIIDETFIPSELETLDFHTNGQPKFVLYDKAGNIKLGASIDITQAGKPAKCIWCHDLTLQPIFHANQVIASRLDADKYNGLINDLKSKLIRYRKDQNSDLDLTKEMDHVLMELLYLGFMEPSAYRLSQEWNMTIEQVETLLKDKLTHPHEEFSILGSHLYDRYEIDALSPYFPISLPSSPRETSTYEPNFAQ